MELKLKKNEYAGRLIVFEGTDGAGKTTMLDMAANYLRARFRRGAQCSWKNSPRIFRERRGSFRK